MNVEDEEWVQHALKDFERKLCISKVLSIDCENAVPKGFNYGSDLYRLKMKTVLYSGDVVSRSLIYKTLPQTEVRRKIIKRSRNHIRESRIYSEFLPQMERLRREKEPGVEPLSPICYGVWTEEGKFLLEDLTEKGYKLSDRENGIDFRHAEMAIKALAEFHALTMVLVEQGDLVPEDFCEDNLVKHINLYVDLYSEVLADVADKIEKEWKGELIHYVDKIREFSKTAIEVSLNQLKFHKSNVNVLNHGDYWTTNMLFKYNEEGLPQSIRIIDFQQVIFRSIGMELHFFFSTSLNADTLIRRRELVHIYHDSLVLSLSKYGLSEKSPSLEDVLASYDKGRECGLFLGLALRPVMVQPSDSIPDDIEQVFKDIFNEGQKKIPKYDIRNLRSVLRPLLEEATSDGIW